MAILILEYDERWPIIYNREKNKILKSIESIVGKSLPQEQVVAIEHIGSTAVVGMAAKPVIDIMLAVTSLATTKGFIEPLQKIGYSYVPEYEATLPDRRFFHRGPSETTGAINRHFHLHIVEAKSSFWIEHILFRDYLRQHKDIATEYVRLKQRLALSCANDINGYVDGKSNFIKEIVKKARKELPYAN